VKIEDVVGLGDPADRRAAVPVRIWLPVAVVLIAVTVTLLTLLVHRSWAPLGGVGLGLLLTVPVATVVAGRGHGDSATG
jgi:Na+-translocating ferredoxin:NAD+ oxidoreductase RnfE subunit